MRYYKQIDDDYITAIGTGDGNTEITETEYKEIMAVILSRPQSDEYRYRLKNDLTWEQYETATNTSATVVPLTTSK